MDPVDELVRFLGEHGIGPWVADAYGRNVLVEAWAEEFVHGASEALMPEHQADAERIERLRELIAEKPGRKSLSVKLINEAIA